MNQPTARNRNMSNPPETEKAGPFRSQAICPECLKQPKNQRIILLTALEPEQEKCPECGTQMEARNGR